jgi:uncharacterized repeat protein (TIGR02543 family)
MKLRRRLMLVQCSALVFSLTALFSATYAWYTANRQVTLQVSNISTETGIEYTLKYFTGNGTLGYFPSDITASDIGYDSGTYHFADATSLGDTPFTISHFYPGKRYSYAIEVTSGFATNDYVALCLSSFQSAASTLDIRQSDSKGIKLAEAISVFAVNYEYSDTAATNNTAAQNFVKGTQTSFDYTSSPAQRLSGDLYNKFHFSYDMIPTNPTDTTSDLTKVNTGTLYSVDQTLATGTVSSFYPTTSTSHKIVLFLSVEFTNDSSSFYGKFKTVTGESTTTNYWAKGISDSNESNAYKSSSDSKGFSLVSMELKRVFNGEITVDSADNSAKETSYLNDSDGTITLPTPATRTGSSFYGYYEPTGKTAYAAGSDVSATAHPNYYALYKTDSHTVTFNPGSGTVTTTSTVFTYGDIYHDLPTPTYTGYTFNGWYTAATGGDLVSNGALFNQTADQTLYAQYTAA